MTLAVPMPIGDALVRLAEIRIAIERYATETWLLEREADDLRARVRLHNAKPVSVAA